MFFRLGGELTRAASHTSDRSAPSPGSTGRSHRTAARAVASVLGGLLAAAELSVTPDAHSAAGDPFQALGIFPAEPTTVAPPQFSCGANTTCKNTMYDNTRFPAYLPKPSLAQFVIIRTG